MVGAGSTRSAQTYRSVVRAKAPRTSRQRREARAAAVLSAYERCIAHR